MVELLCGMVKMMSYVLMLRFLKLIYECRLRLPLVEQSCLIFSDQKKISLSLSKTFLVAKMYTKSFIPAFAGLAMASAQAVPLVQGDAPAPVLLTSTMSGVLPIAPTPFAGVETIEGAITYDGNPMPGFIGEFYFEYRSEQHF